MNVPGLGALIAFIWAVVSLGGAAPAGTPDPTRVLEALRANDARFENLSLKYTSFEDHRIAPDRFRFQEYGDDPAKTPADDGAPRTVRWARSRNLVVRGSDAVLSSQFEPTLSEKDYVAPVAYSKYGNVGGIVYDLSDMQLSADSSSKNVPNYEKQLRITTLRSPLGGLYDTRMAVEFAHGIGFGKRIRSISSVTTDGRRLFITGYIELWTEDISQFEIELDDSSLVRKAVIRSNVHENHNLLEASTEGTSCQSGLLLATSGSFRRTWEPSAEQRKEGRQSKVMQEFRVELGSVELNLSDERYARLAVLRIEPLMQVDDEVNNIHGTGATQEDGTVIVR